MSVSVICNNFIESLMLINDYKALYILLFTTFVFFKLYSDNENDKDIITNSQVYNLMFVSPHLKKRVY